MLEKLMVQIGLKDQVSKPLGKMERQFDTFAKRTQKNFTNIGIGAAGIFAGGAAIQSALMPAIEMDRKMGEVASLGVDEKSLKMLKKEALSFSVAYGKSAKEFVAASYDIKSAMGDLTGTELAGLTKNAGVLAAATKASTTTITDYMGTMYGVFKNDAEKMGKVAWSEKLAGMTAGAVERFKTDGNKLAQSFSTLSATAAGFGVSMEEQFAVLGILGTSKKGSEAATQYKTVLAGAVKAQDALGLSFFDTKGKMIPMEQMLKKIQSRLAGFSSDKKYQILSEAFGGTQAADGLQYLFGQIEEVGKSTKAMGEFGAKGMEKPEQMASKMTDQFERLDAAFEAIKITLGSAVLPAFAKVAEYMSTGSTKLTAYMEKYPELTKYAGFAITAILGIGIALGVATLAVGVFGGALAILTSPITAVIVVVAALAAGVVAFWDYVKPVLVGFYDGFVEAAGLSELFKPMKTIFYAIGDVIGWVIKSIAEMFGETSKGIGTLTTLENIGKSVGLVIGGLFKNMTAGIRWVLDGIQWLIEKLNLLPGVSIDVGNKFDMASMEKTMPLGVMAANVGAMSSTSMPTFSSNSYLKPTTNVPVGGLRSQLTNNSNAKNIYMGGVTINNPDKPWDFTKAEEQAEMSHG